MAVEVRENMSGHKALTIVVRGDKMSEVTAAVARYLQNYDPQGYGTSFSAPKREDGQVICYGHRSTSAD